MTTFMSWWMGCAVGVAPVTDDLDTATGTTPTVPEDTAAIDTAAGPRTPSTGTSGPCDPGVVRDRTCVVDTDCAKVYSDRSYCNCEAVNVAIAWTREDLVCVDWHGPECDYDCVFDPAVVSVCDAGTCTLLGP